MLFGAARVSRPFFCLNCDLLDTVIRMIFGQDLLLSMRMSFGGAS